MRRLAPIGTAVIATATVMLSGSGTASAAGTMHYIGGDGCWTYNQTFQCSDEFTGGTAPYTLTGSTSNLYATIDQMNLYPTDNGYLSSVQGHCDYGRTTMVYISIRDSSGQSLSMSRSISCSPGWSEN